MRRLERISKKIIEKRKDKAAQRRALLSVFQILQTCKLKLTDPAVPKLFLRITVDRPWQVLRTAPMKRIKYNRWIFEDDPKQM